MLNFEEILSKLDGGELRDLASNFPQVLQLYWPELAALCGRIQPPQYHPEGDAFIHTTLVIDRAKELSDDNKVWFGALCHDFGKAITPDDNLPHHYDHESLGIPLVEQFCNRIGAPLEHREVALLGTREHLNIHNFFKLRPITKSRLIHRITASMATPVAIIAQADAQGRGPTLKEKPYPQAQALIRAGEIWEDYHENWTRFGPDNDENKFLNRVAAALDKEFPK